jgi:hypothetical protein
MSSDVKYINIGTQPNDGTGSTVRDAFAIVNSNFANIDQRISTGNISSVTASGTIRAAAIVSNASVAAQTLTLTAGANITGTVTAGRISSGDISAVGSITAPVFIGNLNGTVTGTASAANKLATARKINGVPFDGSADIVILAEISADAIQGSTLSANVTASSLTSLGVLQNLTVANTILGSVSGSAGTVTNPAQNNITSVGTLTNLTVAGDVVTGGNFVGPLLGNAATASKLSSPVAINGVSFDGSAGITVTANASTLSGATLSSNVTASSLTSVGVLTSLVVAGNTYSSRFTGPVTGAIGDVAPSTGAFTALTATGATISGDTVITGNLTVTGAATTVNTNTVTTTDKNIVISSGAANNSQADGSGITVSGANAAITYSASVDSWVLNKSLTATLRTAAQPAITSVGTLNNLNVSGNVTAGGFVGVIYGTVVGNSSTASKLSAPVAINGVAFDGSAGITIAANAATLTNSTLSANVQNSSLTSVGTLGSLNVSGTATASNFTGSFTGSGAGLTGTATQLNIGGNANTATTAGTVTNPAQPNITSVGTLTNLVVSGAITGTLTGNAATASKLATPRAINGVLFDGSAPITITIDASTLTGSVLSSTVTASSLTSVGTLNLLNVTGAVSAGSFSGLATGLTGTASQLNIGGNAATATKLANPVTINGVPFDGSANITITSAAAGSLTGTALPATVVTSNLTSVGTLASLTVAGTITGKVAGATYTESITAPVNPTPGDEWFNTSTNILYKFIGTAWTDVFTAAIGLSGGLDGGSF